MSDAAAIVAPTAGETALAQRVLAGGRGGVSKEVEAMAGGSRAAVLVTLLGLAGAVACERSRPGLDPASVTLSESERALAADSGVPERLLRQLKTAGGSLRRLEGTDQEGRRVPVAGVSVDVPQQQALSQVDRLQQLAAPGYQAFISEQNFGLEPDRVSVLAASSMSEVLRVMGTNGWNYGIGPEQVIERLEQWDERHGLVLVGAGFDWLEARFERGPADMLAFAREVYDFCPDVVEQGAGSVEALAGEMERRHGVYLWWD